MKNWITHTVRIWPLLSSAIIMGSLVGCADTASKDVYVDVGGPRHYDVVAEDGDHVNVGEEIPHKGDDGEKNGDDGEGEGAKGDVSDREKAIDYAWPERPESLIGGLADITRVQRWSFAPFHRDEPSGCCRDFGERSKRPGVDNGFEFLTIALGGYASNSVNDQNEEEGGFNINDLLAGAATKNSLFFSEVAVTPVFKEIGSNRLEGAQMILFAFYGREAQSKEGISFKYGNKNWSAMRSSFQQSYGGQQLDPGATLPKYLSNPTFVENGTMTAKFDQLKVPIPVGPLIVEMPVREVELVGKVNKVGEGSYYGLVDAALSGYVTVDDLFEGLNDLVQENCGCQGKPLRPYNKNRDGSWSGQCSPDIMYSCTDGEEKVLCAHMLQNEGPLGCEMLPAQIQKAADISLGEPTQKGPQVWNAISLGYRVEFEKSQGSSHPSL